MDDKSDSDPTGGREPPVLQHVNLDSVIYLVLPLSLLALILTMTTIISDDELFMYAERAKGKVVVLTGTCHVYVLFEQEMDTPCRRRERYRQGGGHDIFQVWVRCTSQILNPAS